MLPVVSSIVPVIDLKSNQVVHAVAGDRRNYLPIYSQLCDSSTPTKIAQAFADLGFRNVYVADLDAIGGADPDWNSYQAIAASGMKLWVDNGVQKIEYAEKLQTLGHRVIVGLEAIQSLQKFDEIIAAAGADNVIASIDMKSGQLISKVQEWRELSPLDVATQLSKDGIGDFILLDLAYVGTESGVSQSMLNLIGELRAKSQRTRIYSGGGVKSESDVLRMIDAGCDAILVSTALHNRAISI